MGVAAGDVPIALAPGVLGGPPLDRARCSAATASRSAGSTAPRGAAPISGCSRRSPQAISVSQLYCGDEGVELVAVEDQELDLAVAVDVLVEDLDARRCG